jgi:hypothetical protein
LYLSFLVYCLPQFPPSSCIRVHLLNYTSVTPTGRPSLPTSIASTLKQRVIASQAPSPLVTFSRAIKDPTPMTGMILAPNCNNQIQAILVQDSIPFCSYLLTIHKLPSLGPLKQHFHEQGLAKGAHGCQNCTAHHFFRTVCGHIYHEWTNYTLDHVTSGSRGW